ncbi:MAG: MerR family transcriptional regulator [Thermodesulfobacteriota bacterium]
MYMINDVSRQVNLSQKRIREYEREGFINPERQLKTNNRLYTDFEISQIRRINFLIHERGFTVACLRHLLVLAPCWNIFDCQEKAECPAYQFPHLPCWKVREEREARCPGPCVKCAIFISRHHKRERVLEKQYSN